MRIKTVEQVHTLVNKAIKVKQDKHKAIAKKYKWCASQPIPNSLALKVLKRTGIFKATNVEFNPIAMEATSYNWWYFVKRIKGKIVFNNYSYSNCTSRYQYKVSSVMDQLGIKVDVEIKAPKGLQDLNSALAHYEAKNCELMGQINRPRSHKKTNAYRVLEIKANLLKIKQIKSLMK
jgi:hypothetical protein